MTGGSSGKKRLWRWRHNPLRRRDDIMEAWIVLAMLVLVAVGGSVAGLLTAHAADEVFAGQRAERHTAKAVLLADVPATLSGVGHTAERMSAKVRWTTSDGVTHTGTTLVKTGLKAGGEVVVWLDGQGDLSTEPPSPTEGAIEAAVLGTGAALATAGLVTGVGALVRWRLNRRRIDEWGREWKLVGPQWGHQTS
jgi:hypothetical protein